MLRRAPAFAFVVATAAALTFGSTSVRSEIDFTGNSMLPFCRLLLTKTQRMNGTEAFFAGWCGGTVVAVRNLIADREIPDTVRSCTPLEVTNEQAFRVAVRFMDNHPELLHLDL